MKRFFKYAFAMVVCLITAVLGVFFWYFPRYLACAKPVSVTPAGENTTVMGYNLRCIAPEDLGKKSWFYRAGLVLEDIRTQKPGILGFQEATWVHYNFLVKTLPQYDSVITYRDDFVLSEGCPIFYHRDLYTLKDKGSFWLSETPEVMSKDWGSACYRICSYVILTDKATGRDFVVFNTHLDHVSDEARIKGMEVVLDKIAGFGGLPAIVMGDLNAEEGSATIDAATEHFRDARYAAPETEDSYTYQNWGNMEKAVRIDYFMISDGIAPIRYDVLTDTHDGVYSSDHCPIVLTFTIE